MLPELKIITNFKFKFRDKGYNSEIKHNLLIFMKPWN